MATALLAASSAFATVGAEAGSSGAEATLAGLGDRLGFLGAWDVGLINVGAAGATGGALNLISDT
ncbi:MAG: hypothetical protein Q7U28_02105 [Aquabacterium sp.]|nr:hypothetical protein [Aquabacterium sp.]